MEKVTEDIIKPEDAKTFLAHIRKQTANTNVGSVQETMVFMQAFAILETFIAQNTPETGEEVPVIEGATEPVE